MYYRITKTHRLVCIVASPMWIIGISPAVECQSTALSTILQETKNYICPLPGFIKMPRIRPIKVINFSILITLKFLKWHVGVSEEILHPICRIRQYFFLWIGKYFYLALALRSPIYIYDVSSINSTTKPI